MKRLSESSHNNEQNEVINNDWAVSYSDVISLLLVFFVMLISISTVDPEKVKNISEAIADKESYQAKIISIGELNKQVRKVIEEKNLGAYTKITVENNNIKIDINDKILFAIGNAELSQRSKLILKELLLSFKRLPSHYRFEIEGHTDDVPINNDKYPSNWYLSSDRALSVLDLFLYYGFDSKRFTVQGFADTKPLVKYKNAQGNIIPGARAKNRRISIKVR